MKPFNFVNPQGNPQAWYDFMKIMLEGEDNFFAVEAVLNNHGYTVTLEQVQKYAEILDIMGRAETWNKKMEENK